ncbi:MAG: flagellar M-ring protein FliF [Burkholderiales bacterium RIFCSPLOWO2_12_FULL_64_99]|uniref:flagellar basal-body MS-ring/collar protein FliF n=1 Tax=Aquabacterium sp. TaxID=1872578 RepID=UPI0008ACE132|nr:flagellar basal-body MS-ring/collar protein FliF [Aquabacterium sp.]OGB05138.1 MAG: flagellar M-ring protein FliF [Burkholderiales bacterium RIFCSPHIGHO2_12_FULL_63_20]OGB60749.1 MAG: flagellar M-ring protein FliF [Burkholderiales bacterium RIFCSPLOWO2_12_FULL_64_99]
MEVSVTQPQSVAPLSPNQVLDANASQPPGFAQRVMALPVQRKLMLGGGIAAIVAIFVAMMLWGREGDYRVLYTNLSDKDGGAILAQLQQMQVPYKHADGGAAILVPAEKVHDVRLKLASAGLPKGSVVGFELMENQKFGTTQFQERLNFQRGLEGELVRSIQALSSVQSARVHLALPNQNGFFREQQKASASVVLTLYTGRTLDRGQIAGIVHLVSSSVPEMSPKAVSIVDQTGALLSGPQEGVDHAGLDAQQLQYVRQIETNYAQRIRDILEPVVGKENLRAQVTAELDFSQTESTAEEYKPNQGAQAQATVRSQQTSEQSGSTGATAAGVPGATTNQPPVPATAPINGASAPLQAAQVNGSALSSGRREAVTNYEVDKTVRVTRSATGNIKRLNAAVVLNHRTITDAKGKTTTQPIPDEELEKLTALVREAIGVDDRRGDSIKVVNTPFQVVKDEPVDTPMWQQPETVDLIRTLAVPGALTLAALIVVFGAIRPAIKAARPVPVDDLEQGKLSAVVDDAQELPALNGMGMVLGPDGQPLTALEAPGTDRRLESARALARGNPQALANVVRGWMNN